MSNLISLAVLVRSSCWPARRRPSCARAADGDQSRKRGRHRPNAYRIRRQPCDGLCAHSDAYCGTDTRAHGGAGSGSLSVGDAHQGSEPGRRTDRRRRAMDYNAFDSDSTLGDLFGTLSTSEQTCIEGWFGNVVLMGCGPTGACR